MTYRIRIEYMNFLAQKAGVRHEYLEVNEALNVAYEELKNHIAKEHNIIPPYIIFLNDKNILKELKKGGYLLTDSDKITLYGVVAGG